MAPCYAARLAYIQRALRHQAANAWLYHGTLNTEPQPASDVSSLSFASPLLPSRYRLGFPSGLIRRVVCSAAAAANGEPFGDDEARRSVAGGCIAVTKTPPIAQRAQIVCPRDREVSPKPVGRFELVGYLRRPPVVALPVGSSGAERIGSRRVFAQNRLSPGESIRWHLERGQRKASRQWWTRDVAVPDVDIA